MIAPLDKPDLSMTRLVSFRSAHNIPADGGDLRTQPVANFTSSYVDKILTKKREFCASFSKVDFTSFFIFSLFVNCHFSWLFVYLILNENLI